MGSLGILEVPGTLRSPGVAWSSQGVPEVPVALDAPEISRSL